MYSPIATVFLVRSSAPELGRHSTCKCSGRPRHGKGKGCACWAAIARQIAGLGLFPLRLEPELDEPAHHHPSCGSQCGGLRPTSAVISLFAFSPQRLAKMGDGALAEILEA